MKKTFFLAILSLGTMLFGQEEQTACDPCSYCNCLPCEPWCQECRPCGPLLGLKAFFAWESFRSRPDGTYVNNNGALVGLNMGYPAFGDFGIGIQAGGTFGVYDFNGSMAADSNKLQTQEFLTVGLFKRMCGGSRWTAGVVYDWMFNQHGTEWSFPNFNIQQVRGEIDYRVTRQHELGIWGAFHTRSATRSTTLSGGPVTMRGINQLNLSWRYYFERGGFAGLYAGAPLGDRVNSDQEIGLFIVGGSFNIPASRNLVVYGNAMYLKPKNSSYIYIQDEAFNAKLGVSWYYGGVPDVCGNCTTRWEPLMPVADNATFIMDMDNHT